MREWGKLETGTVVTISTAHITKDALDLLNAVHREQSREVEDPRHWINDLVWGVHPYGFMVTGHGLRRRLEEEKDGTPEFLLKAGELASDLKLAWLVYDEDGDTIEGIPDYYNEGES